MEELCRDTWMRLMYISSYKVQGGKEAVLHRYATAINRLSACRAWTACSAIGRQGLLTVSLETLEPVLRVHMASHRSACPKSCV